MQKPPEAGPAPEVWCHPDPQHPRIKAQVTSLDATSSVLAGYSLASSPEVSLLSTRQGKLALPGAHLVISMVNVFFEVWWALSSHV